MKIALYPLGAGQDVGRSCVLVSLGDAVSVMFDCGLHMGYEDARRFPDFRRLSPSGSFDGRLDAVVVSHFHLDHLGALPFFTERCGFTGPVYMTTPTYAVAHVMLDDYRKVSRGRGPPGGEPAAQQQQAPQGPVPTAPSLGQEPYTDDQIKRCLRKVTTVSLEETVEVPLQRGQKGTLKLTAYYAGHVLGAAMFHASYQTPDMAEPVTAVYTGDYNTRSDRHLGPATLPQGLRPDVLISESTYADTVRDAKRGREREFLNAIHDTLVHHGGKVLIPVFALGRAQELCILLDEFWERLGWRGGGAAGGPPIYCTGGMAAQANQYYDLYARWMNERRQEKAAEHGGALRLGQVRVWERGMERRSDLGPCVLLATPGMLHGGTSLDAFVAWCGDPRNLVVLPGYCVSGTVGSKLRESPRGVLRRVDVGPRSNGPGGVQSTMVDVRCAVRHLSFSAHADARGILGLIKQAEPRHVVLVHGEKAKMARLSAEVAHVFGTPCYYPANHTRTVLESACAIPVSLSDDVLREGRWAACEPADGEDGAKRPRVLSGALVLDTDGARTARFVTAREALTGAGLVPHTVSCEVELAAGAGALERAHALLLDVVGADAEDGGVRRGDSFVAARSVHVRTTDGGSVRVSWLADDAPLARRCMDALAV